MKRCLTWLMLLAAVLLTACGAKGPYEVKKGDRTFLVDPAARTVSWEGYTAAYSTGSDGETDWVELTYPDGSTFRRVWKDGTQGTMESRNYDPARYLPGEEVLAALDREVPTGALEPKWMGAALGALFLGLGGYYALFPGMALARRTGGVGGSGSAMDSPVARRMTRGLGLLGAALGAVILLWALLPA